MKHPPTFSWTRWLRTGTYAGLLSMAALAWHGRRRHGSSVSLINAPSHWIHGDRALRANQTSWRFTLPGTVIHQASSLFWSAIYECCLNGRRTQSNQTGSAVVMAATQAVGLTVLAWAVDTRLIPDRLSPGFQRRSSKSGMLLIYGSFAVGLFVGTLVQSRNRDR